jgi:hypothetical protein
MPRSSVTAACILITQYAIVSSSRSITDLIERHPNVVTNTVTAAFCCCNINMQLLLTSTYVTNYSLFTINYLSVDGIIVHALSKYGLASSRHTLCTVMRKMVLFRAYKRVTPYGIVTN